MRYFSRTAFLLSNLSVELDFLQVLFICSYLLLFAVLSRDLMVLVPGFGCLICRSGNSSF
jgi:hypothetical protein